MTIKEAIKQRIERFNRLWIKAVGYSFEDEVNIKQKEFDEWKAKANNRAKELGYNDYHEYRNKLWSFYDDGGIEGWYVSDKEGYDNTKDDILDKLLDEAPSNSPLYLYEMSVLNEVEKVVNFLYTKNEDLKKAWESYLTDEKTTYGDLAHAMENDGYKFDDGHSGNSLSASLMLTNTFIYNPDLFQYQHGSLATLVGDSGYYDDRSDVKEYLSSRNN